MGTLLIKDAAVVTLSSRGSVFPRADVAIVDGTILAIGEPPPGFRAEQTIEAGGHVALPGFFNAHTHAAMTLVRGWAEDLPLDRWFNERIWVAESALTEEDVYWGAALAACEMIRGGTVGFADHYFWMDRVAEAVEQSGLRASLAWCVFGLGGSHEIGGTTLAATEAFVRRWQGAGNGRIRTVLGPHSPYVCTPEFLGQVADASDRLDVGVHLHVSESREQVATSLTRHGATPVGLLDRVGLLRRPALLAHGIYLSGEDVEILPRADATVVQCPNCHMKLAMGVTPVPWLLQKRVRVALGTDGAASNDNLDMLEEVRLASLLHKHHSGDAQAMPGDLPLRLATEAGALSMGFPESGRIEAGRAADIILLDFRRAHLTPRHDIVASLVHSAQSGDVSDVIVAGRVVMRDRVLLTLDEDRIIHEAEARGLRMVSRPLTAVREYRQWRSVNMAKCRVAPRGNPQGFGGTRC